MRIAFQLSIGAGSDLATGGVTSFTGATGVSFGIAVVGVSDLA